MNRPDSLVLQGFPVSESQCDGLPSGAFNERSVLGCRALPADDPSGVGVDHERGVGDLVPVPVVRGTKVKSATSNRFGAGTDNCRSTRSGARVAVGSTTVVRTFFARVAPRQPLLRISRSTVHRATGTQSRRR